MESHENITEHIKWNAPSFCVNNKDRITFNFHGKEGFRLVFHCGSKKSGHEDGDQLVSDKTGLLQWVAGDRALVSILSESDFEEKKEKLAEAVSTWLDATKDI